MEYVIVKFPHDRVVFIDDKEQGKTNEILRIGAGVHVFGLGEPRDYTPDEIEKLVDGTSSINPLEVLFGEV